MYYVRMNQNLIFGIYFKLDTLHFAALVVWIFYKEVRWLVILFSRLFDMYAKAPPVAVYPGFWSPEF